MPDGLARRVEFGTPSAAAVLPLADAVMAAWAGDGRMNDLDARSALRVVVVDDDRDATDSLALLVDLWGHEVRRAYSGAGGLALVADAVPDVVFIDITMPEIDGAQLARHLRAQARCADALLVAVTGWADVSHRRLWESAFDHYLIKPVVPDVLETLLRDRARLVRSRAVAAGLVALRPTRLSWRT
jgi:CheY-like chemotaxis protein